MFGWFRRRKQAREQFERDLENFRKYMPQLPSNSPSMVNDFDNRFVEATEEWIKHYIRWRDSRKK